CQPTCGKNLMKDWVSFLPAFNASCNACSVAAILLGWQAIRAKRITRHRNWMVTAFAFSILFLTGYLTRHYFSGTTHFKGTGPWRNFYFLILATHTILAVVNLPLLIISLRLGFRNEINKHKKLVQFTLPIWLYVSSTGVLIYFLLYRWFV